MKTLVLPIPPNSAIHRAQTSILEKGGIKVILIDFENSRISQQHAPLFSLMTDANALIIRCDFPSVFILDVFFIIISCSRWKRIFLDTKEISKQSLTLLKEIGLEDLCSDCNYGQTSVSRRTTRINTRNECDAVIAKLANLSKTEVVILYYLSLGLTNGQISDLACRSYHTVKNHKLNIVRKVGFEHCHQLLELCQSMKFASL